MSERWTHYITIGVTMQDGKPYVSIVNTQTKSDGEPWNRDIVESVHKAYDTLHLLVVRSEGGWNFYRIVVQHVVTTEAW